jgi:methyl-accepting chemotaxis protein
MKLWGSLGIAKRLYVVCAVVALSLGGVAAVAYTKLTAVSHAAEQTGQLRVPQLQNIAAMELIVTRVSLQLRHAILSRTPEELAATLGDIDAKRKLLDSTLASYERGLFTPEGKKRFAHLPPRMAGFWEAGAANLALIEAGKKEEAFAFLVDKTIPARNALLDDLHETVAYQEASLERELDGIQVQARSTLTALVSMVVASMLVLVVFAGYLGALLRRRVAASQAVAERVRDGDLTTPVDDLARDEFSPLLAALGNMQGALTRVVADVRSNAQIVASASQEIAQGNQDLSQRTEQQASVLQQTAETMDNLGSTVRANADSAAQANQLAQGASAVALRGGEAVGQVVETMKGINDASRRIGDIIAVIDGIAFQTNILALNAAVEAARAGEQGRGFAVVAAEVRSLAQRSAEAAREIKSLISTSVERVEAGTSQVGQAGQTMDEIVAAIRRVSDVVGEISSASAEQSASVGQVGHSVSQMDQATQQNAALVEQSAAAAESLTNQAARLVEAVAVFRIGADGVKPTAPRALPAPAVQAKTQIERRGPNRATNVTRPSFVKQAKPVATLPANKPAAGAPTAAPSAAASSRTGTDDWEQF